MISSKSMNKLFNSLAKFVSQLTGKSIQFHQIAQNELVNMAYEKMNKFFESASEALDNPNARMLGVLEPGKIYCIQVDIGKTNIHMFESVWDFFSSNNIQVIVIDQNMNFISIPEGYEVVKKE